MFLLEVGSLLALGLNLPQLVQLIEVVNLLASVVLDVIELMDVIRSAASTTFLMAYTLMNWCF